jgi:isopenicillin N synthase-like dioxygenase
MSAAWQEDNRGYVGVQREHLDESKPGDLKEAFNVGYSSNRWPSEQVQLKTQSQGKRCFMKLVFTLRIDFYQECLRTSLMILSAFALALGLKEVPI